MGGLIGTKDKKPSPEQGIVKTLPVIFMNTQKTHFRTWFDQFIKEPTQFIARQTMPKLRSYVDLKLLTKLTKLSSMNIKRGLHLTILVRN